MPPPSSCWSEPVAPSVSRPSKPCSPNTAGTLGKGWVYGLNTALDEIGATLGPLLVALILFLGGNYQAAYGLLLISALLTLSALTFARANFPLPSRLEEGRTAPAEGFTRTYWLYMVAGAFFAAGLMSFELISYHLANTKLVSESWIPVMLSFSTGCAAIASLVLGKLYDRAGSPVVLAAVFLSSLFAPFVFQGSLAAALIAMPLWGIGYATQDTLLKVLIAGVLPEGKTQHGLRTLLHRIWRRLADRQRRNRIAL